jgi:hypothetical protein
MSEVDKLLQEIDTLSPMELERIYQHIVQRRQPGYWLIPGENLKRIRDIMQPVYEQADEMSDEEIDAAIDEALDEVRGEHKTHRRD